MTKAPKLNNQQRTALAMVHVMNNQHPGMKVPYLLRSYADYPMSRPTLKALVNRGLLSEENRIGVPGYVLTEAGEAEVAKFPPEFSFTNDITSRYFGKNGTYEKRYAKGER